MFNALHIHVECPLKIALFPSLHMKLSVTIENIPTKSDTVHLYPLSFSH